MDRINKKYTFILLMVFTIIGLTFIGIRQYMKYQKEELLIIHEKLLKENLSKVFADDSNKWPKKVNYRNDEYEIIYTFNDHLTRYIRKLLRRKSADYSSVTVIDNNTGEILSAVGYDRVGKKFINNLPFTSTHPSASLIKIITAAELLEKNKINSDTIFSVNGKGSTLYKYQLRDKITKWTRFLSFRKAFAYSNNVIFGKAAIQNISSVGMLQMARNFGFNSNLFKELNMTKSIFNMPKNQYNLAEYASGLNRKTLISPIHGAVISSIVANNGILKEPKMVKKVINVESGETVWKNNTDQTRVIRDRTGKSLKSLMSFTVKKGTARRMFSRMKRKLKHLLEIGGKTGSITGGLPYGKRDWLTAYAMPAGEKDKGISICVMNINKKKWYIKSTYLARKIIEYYYSILNPVQ